MRLNLLRLLEPLRKNLSIINIRKFNKERVVKDQYIVRNVYDDRCIIFNIVVLLATLLYLVMFCNYAVAQVNTNTLESLANNTNVLASAQINVGKIPFNSHIRVGVYVANARSDTVSVISNYKYCDKEYTGWQKSEVYCTGLAIWRRNIT